METNFANNFIIKQKRERFLFELKKKRSGAIDRFAHNATTILDSKKIVLSGERLQKDDIMKELLKHISMDVCVVIISGDENFDKKIVKLSEGVKIFFDTYLQMVITDGERFALIKEEISGNCSQKYLLVK